MRDPFGGAEPDPFGGDDEEGGVFCFVFFWGRVALVSLAPFLGVASKQSSKGAII